MANDFTANPLYIDTASAGTTDNYKIKNIIVNASGDNWEVVLHDIAGGRVIFHAKSNIANHRFVQSNMGGMSVTGVYATTLTNIDDVLVVTKD